MKVFTKILIGLLFLTTLIPVAIAKLCLFDQAKALEFFNAEILTPDIEKILFVLGGFMLATAAMPIMAIVWLINKKEGGFALSYVVGLIALLRGLLTLANFSSHNIESQRLTITPIVIGLILLLFTYLADKQQRKVALA